MSAKRLSELSENARKIIAARVLAGLEKQDLATRMDEHGFGIHDIPKLERDDPKMPFTPARRDAVAQICGVTKEWFTAPIEQLQALPAASANGDLGQIQRVVEANAKALEEIQQRLDPGDPLGDIDDSGPSPPPDANGTGGSGPSKPTLEEGGERSDEEQP